jgi:hypothetical protein
MDVPSQFIAGRSDWGVYQTPGSIFSMAPATGRSRSGRNLRALPVQFPHNSAKA